MLHVNSLVGFGAFTSSSTISITGVDSGQSDSNSASYSFALAPAKTGKWLAVVCGRSAGSSPTVTSVDVGASITGSRISDGSTNATVVDGINILEWWYLDGTIGASDTLDVDFGVTMGNCGFALFEIEGNSSSQAHEVLTDTVGSPLSVNLDIPAKGGAVAGHFNNNTGPNATWSNLTEYVDATVDAANGVGYSAASDNFATQQTNLAISCTLSSASGNEVFCAVSYGP